MNAAIEAAAKVLETGNPQSLPPAPGVLIDEVVRKIVQGSTGLTARSTAAPTRGLRQLTIYRETVSRRASSQKSTAPSIPEKARFQIGPDNADLREACREAVLTHLRSGQEVELPPMTLNDRRFVHAFIQQLYGLKTKSVGAEGDRRVVVKSEA